VTAHLLVVYPTPKNTDDFDRDYKEKHLPYAGPRLKGATSVVTKRVVGPAFAPPPYHMISDVTFPTIDALKACAMSDSGKEALAHAASISTGGQPTLMVVSTTSNVLGAQGASRRRPSPAPHRRCRG
jgi:uncharacterized protein (TIGR02118 family)